MRTPEARPEVKSAARILDLLELLGAAAGPLRHSEIARHMEMPKSSASALLDTLEGRGYVTSGADGYVLAEHYREGGWALGEYGVVLRVARGAMQRVAQETGESAFLAVPVHDWQVRYVEKVVSENPLRYDIPLGTQRPAHSTSVGRVLLAEMPDDMLQRYLASERVAKVTPKTVTDPRKIMAAIERVRRDGCALISDSSVVGASGVAAPIRDPSGAVLASLCVIAPSARFAAAAESITRIVCDAAARIGAALPAAAASPDGTRPRRRSVWKA